MTVPGENTASPHGRGIRRGNPLFVAAACVGLVALTSALLAPAFQKSPADAQSSLLIEAGVVLLSALVAWSFSGWSVIVNLGIGFAVTICLNLGDAAIRALGEPSQQVSADQHKLSLKDAATQSAGAAPLTQPFGTKSARQCAHAPPGQKDAARC